MESDVPQTYVLKIDDEWPTDGAGFDDNKWGVNLEFSIIKMVKSLMEF